jgi:CRP/FNR family transcriptional regulator, cyclic AMP receptor protein
VVEQRTHKPLAAGSIPAPGTIHLDPMRPLWPDGREAGGFPKRRDCLRPASVHAPREMAINIFKSDPNAEKLPAGHAVFREGERGDHMFAVVKGSVDLVINGKIVETVEPGGVFGEMALVEEQPRVATAVVKADAELVRIDRKRFLFLVQQTPYFSLQLMAIMAKRIRQMNKRLR